MNNTECSYRLDILNSHLNQQFPDRCIIYQNGKELYEIVQDNFSTFLIRTTQGVYKEVPAATTLVRGYMFTDEKNASLTLPGNNDPLEFIEEP